MSETGNKVWFTKLNIVLFVVIAILILISYSLNAQVDNMYDNYVYGCGEGKQSVCIDEGNWYEEYGEDEYVVLIGEDETYVVCDTDRKEYAVCVEEDKQWTQCDTGEYPRCFDSDSSWTSCEAGKNARCVKEDSEGTISSGFVSYCGVGESSTCIDWSRYSVTLN